MSNQSTKLDYLCKTKDEILFIELKTDATSLKIEQAEIYLNTSWNQCLYDLELIYKSIKNKLHKKKYDKLLSTINSLQLTEENKNLRVLYISPLPKEKSNFLSTISIINPQHLKDLKIVLTEQEQQVWNYLIDFDLYIFEIKKLYN